MALNRKQRAFADAFLTTLNATKAARQAGYSAKTASAIGYDLLRHPEIAPLIERRLTDMAMSAEEALARLGEIARNVAAEYIQTDGKVDLAGLRRDGLMHLVKGIKHTRFGDEVVFVNPETALMHIVRVHGLVRDRLEIEDTGQGDDASEQLARRIDSLAARLRASRGDS